MTTMNEERARVVDAMCMTWRHDFREGPLTLRLKRPPQHPNSEGSGDE